MNILFLFTDQMHRYAMGCMGNPDVNTPNLDRLAQQGVLFRQAYSNCPVCTPFRINLMTGLYTCQTKTFNNNAPIPPGIPTLADTLNAGGYHTSYVGKWHIGNSGNKAVPEELRGGFTDFIGYQCYNGFRENVTFFDETNTPHTFKKHRTDVTTDIAIERLEQIADRPFAMFVSYQAPHYPVQPGPAYEAMYREKPITRRPNIRDINPYTPTHDPPSPQPPGHDSDYQRYGHDLDEYIRLYYAMVSQVDAGVGRLLETVERLGLRENTVVIFTSDHGDMQGSQGLKNKCLPYEESSGIPLIVSAPDGASGLISDALVSGIDFYPTCLEYAGVLPQPPLPGISIAPFTFGQPQHLDRPVFSERPEWKMVRKGPYKLVTDSETYTPTHLFNLSTDPYELHNLVEDEQWSEVRDTLRADIITWQQTCCV